MKISPQRDGIAFSVLELLAVMGILAMLSVFALPAVSSLGASQGVKQGIYDIAGLLELARNEAVTRQSYVWVGFENTVVNNQAVLCMAAAVSKDGSANAVNLVPLTRVIQVKNAAMVDWSSLKAETRACFSNGAPVSVAQNDASASVPSQGGRVLSRSMTFTPRGEALLESAPGPSAPYDRYIDVSFRQTKGTEILARADDAALIVEGSTGAVLSVRLK